MMVRNEIPPFEYRCTTCGRSFERDAVTYLCPVCGEDYQEGQTLSGVLRVDFDYEYIHRRFECSEPDWRLFSAVEPSCYPNFAVGHTPYFPANRLQSLCGFDNVYIKNDALNPSGSLKDRASFLVAAEAIRKKIGAIVAASTGNAASALAAVCAASGLHAVIYAPAAAPKAKLLQVVLYGAELVAVDGDYDQAFALSLAHSRKKNALNRNTAYHPLTIEGKKTAALEIFAQNGMKVPQAILVPVGDGVIISGIYKGFLDLMNAGLSDRLPRLIAVQAEGSAAIHRYIQTGHFSALKMAQTIADSISVAAPSNAHMAREAIVESGGFSLTVGDEEILEAQQALASHSGIFAEPAAAAALAGLLREDCRRQLSDTDAIVLLITGHGLKDIEAPLKSTHIPEARKPEVIMQEMEYS